MNQPTPQERSSHRFQNYTRGLVALSLLAAASTQTPHLSAQATPAAAPQEGAGVVRGRVFDNNGGKYLEGAEVSLQGTSFSAVTERSGAFTLRNVPAGTYTVVVNYTGLDTKTETVVVSAGQTAELNVGLSEGDVINLTEFRVQGAKEGMSQAVALQKVSFQTKLVAAADQFGPIAEGNVGEYLKFLPGLSVDYNANDARGVSLRGLNTSFTVVAVDGTPMAASSSVADTRRFEFEQIAMNNVETTELFKTVTPDIPASATGGFVNFVTKSAFDRQDASVLSYDFNLVVPSTNLSIGKESGVWGNGKEFVARPNLDLNYSRRINEKVGINFNYRFSERYDDSPRTEITWVPEATMFTAPRLQQYNIRTEQKITHREAFATKLDYHISEDTKLMVAGQWNWYDLLFHQRGPQIQLGTTASNTRAGDPNNPTFSSTTPVVLNDVTFRNKYGTTLHFNSTLTHQFANASKASLTAYWSHADGQYRDSNKGFVGAQARLNTGASVFDRIDLAGATTRTLPAISLYNNAGTTPVSLDYMRSLSNYTLSPGATLQARPWTTNETKTGLSGNYSYDLPIDAMPVTIQAGFALDKTERDITRTTLRSAFTAITGATLAQYRDEGFTKDVGFGFGSYQVIDPYKIYGAYQNAFTAYFQDLYREFEEDNLAGYVRFDIKPFADLLIVGGFRWEERQIDGWAVDRAIARSGRAQTHLKYDKIYPSLSAKYTPSWQKSLVVRGGVSKTVGHPDYADLIGVVTVESAPGANDGSITGVNPGLQPYFTTNYDLGAEYYLKNSGVLSIALFRKNVKNYIVDRGMTAADIAAVAAASGLNPAQFVTGTIRDNGADSSIQGVELGYAQNLTFLPAPFDKFNVQTNFTMSDADGDDIDVLWAQQRGAASKTFNFVLGYRIGKWSITSSTNWTDDTVASGLVNSEWILGTRNANPALDTRMVSLKSDVVRTDLKVEYAFSSRYKVYFAVQNMLGAGRDDYLRGYTENHSEYRLPRNHFQFGEPYYNIGVRGAF
jgi:iron complex outermembrane receptor protein